MKSMDIYHAVDQYPKGNDRVSATWEILSQNEQGTWKFY